ncbi:hypothetical protein [Corynebacterium urinipleomorphum]|uniref:hypothetical protein n=1 Tax=Corynebacterium urinipleomorphum TaxID=1852380 RepID=UPI000B360F82|nr:hypothetical protein [Corynebacterium urinipleomorphum]
MRFAPKAVAAATTVALATGVSVAPAAQAQTAAADERMARDALVSELGLSFAPPAVRIGKELYVLIDGTYVKADRELPSHVWESLRGPDREQPQPENASEGTGMTGSSTSTIKSSSAGDRGEKPNVARWLVPLLVTGGVIAGLAGLIQKLYPSGRLILYFQPGKPVTP